MKAEWIQSPESILTNIINSLVGLAQCAELVTQLRGEAGKRQVDGARVAMQHNFGIGGAAVVTMYKKYDSQVKGFSAQAKLWSTK